MRKPSRWHIGSNQGLRLERKQLLPPDNRNQAKNLRLTGRGRGCKPGKSPLKNDFSGEGFKAGSAERFRTSTFTGAYRYRGYSFSICLTRCPGEKNAKEFVRQPIFTSILKTIRCDRVVYSWAEISLVTNAPGANCHRTGHVEPDKLKSATRRTCFWKVVGSQRLFVTAIEKSFKNNCEVMRQEVRESTGSGKIHLALR